MIEKGEEHFLDDALGYGRKLCRASVHRPSTVHEARFLSLIVVGGRVGVGVGVVELGHSIGLTAVPRDLSSAERSLVRPSVRSFVRLFVH